MKSFFYKLTFGCIMIGGVCVGVMKGQDAKQKWVAKKKDKFLNWKAEGKHRIVILDEIEMATYHS